MRSATRTLAALGAAAALAGCPLPQPLPDYPPGTITPPRILVDGIAAHGNAVVLVPAGCDVEREPVYPLTAFVYDTNTNESIESRWFVNYHARWHYDTAVPPAEIPPDPDPTVLSRVVPPRDPITGAERPFMFRPYYHPPPYGAPAAQTSSPYDAPGIVHVVELVVSNGFDPDVVAPPGLPYRTPKFAFETQVYRWVFLTVAETAGPCDPASDPRCVKCPQ